MRAVHNSIACCLPNLGNNDKSLFTKENQHISGIHHTHGLKSQNDRIIALFNTFSPTSTTRNIWRQVRRICMWISGLKGFTSTLWIAGSSLSGTGVKPQTHGHPAIMEVSCNNRTWNKNKHHTWIIFTRFAVSKAFITYSFKQFAFCDSKYVVVDNNIKYFEIMKEAIRKYRHPLNGYECILAFPSAQ